MSSRLRNYVKEGDGDPRHGLPGTYRNHHCHCPACQAAHAVFQKEFMDRHPEQREKARLRERLRRRARVKQRVT